MTTYTTHNAEETLKIGKDIGNGLEAGDTVCIHGDLGAGKTCLVQGIARGLGVSENEYVRSPTFTILHSHPGRLTLHHFDFYRLSGPGEIEDLGLDEFLQGDGVCAVEWPERLGPLSPEKRIEVRIIQVSDTRRDITINHLTTKKEG